MKRIAVLLVFLVVSAAEAEVTMGVPFREGAVLQREKRVPVWGTAAPGAEVTVEFAGQLNGIDYYIAERLIWNSEQSVDAIIDDYCQTGFGAGARSIRSFPP